MEHIKMGVQFMSHWVESVIVPIVFHLFRPGWIVTGYPGPAIGRSVDRGETYRISSSFDDKWPLDDFQEQRRQCWLFGDGADPNVSINDFFYRNISLRVSRQTGR